MLEGRAATRDEIVGNYADCIKRHPDLDLQFFQTYLEEFGNLSGIKQLVHLDDLQETFNRMNRVTRSTLLGFVEIQTAWKTFSPNGFTVFFDAHEYPDTRRFTEPPAITGDKQVDKRIVNKAIERGYRLRSEAELQDLSLFAGQYVQPEVAASWEALTREAQQYGIKLGIVSGFRSVERQRIIFLSLLAYEAEREIGREFTHEEIVSGKADAVINRVLKESSIPGFSKHHSGYTIDITDVISGRDFTEFRETTGYQWMATANYLNAKRYGFLPSYPEGAGDLGPEPEAWEYVWVGSELLQETSIHSR